MGYVPPLRTLKDIDGRYFDHPRFGVDAPSDFGLQWMGGRADRPPETPFRRYIWDLYGPPRRDWFPLLNYGLLASAIVLVLAVVLPLVAL